jgi:hypothetical protein
MQMKSLLLVLFLFVFVAAKAQQADTATIYVEQLKLHFDQVTHDTTIMFFDSTVRMHIAEVRVKDSALRYSYRHRRFYWKHFTRHKQQVRYEWVKKGGGIPATTLTTHDTGWWDTPVFIKKEN